jgi:hypothetical protein
MLATIRRTLGIAYISHDTTFRIGALSMLAMIRRSHEVTRPTTVCIVHDTTFGQGRETQSVMIQPFTRRIVGVAHDTSCGQGQQIL